MYDVSIPMALVDYIPVLFFGWAAVLLQRDLYRQMPKYAFACFAAGTIDIFAAGFLKNTMFLPTQSIGFLLAGLGMALMLASRKKAALAAAPPVFSGSFLFIGMMVLGLAD